MGLLNMSGDGWIVANRDLKRESDLGMGGPNCCAS